MKKVLGILGIGLIVMTMFFNVSTLTSSNENNNLLTLIGVKNANAAGGGDVGKLGDCLKDIESNGSNYGWKYDAGTNCKDKKGDYCGKAYKCDEDTEMPLLPPNVVAGCTQSKCQQK